ncbi:MAG: GIY-YIG nuclease family protein [Planctomycetales bacterium]|nr:GIY-YIG nuclease family protein [Planctomycetales bacterium]
MTSRITVTCPQCNAKLAVGSENAGKRLRCPKCQTIVEVPDGNEDDVVPPTQETTLWKVVIGTQKGGPFGKAKLRQLVDVEKLPGEAFVRDDAGATDWCEVQTIDWLFDFPERRAVRYCPECDCRVLISGDARDTTRRCPDCEAPVRFADYLNFDGNVQLNRVPAEPWGKFDVLIILAAAVALAGGFFGALSLLWNPPLAVLIGFIFLVAGGGLFSVTFHHRSQSSKYRSHLPKVEHALDARTEQLINALNELNGLKRSLVRVRSKLVEDTEEEFRKQREELAEQLETAKDSVNAVHRMAERFLDETWKWWTSKLTGENLQTTKDRITKAIGFCRKNGYPVSSKHEHELMKQLKTDYELVLKREHERSEQARFREQMREEQRVERELKRELERIDAEKRAIERALSEALKTAGADHSAEIDALRERLRDAEERGQRTKAQAELTKVGNVYVISNIGSFGENVFKVGLTRRLVPDERVKELGDASVPFTFDVHMMIRSDDAPKLECTLHQALHRFRVNRVNFRKEFFRVDLATIRKVVELHHGEVECFEVPEATAFRESLRISDDELMTKTAEAATVEDEDEDDDLDGADEVLPNDVG